MTAVKLPAPPAQDGHGIAAPPEAVRFTPTLDDTLAAYRLAVPVRWQRMAMMAGVIALAAAAIGTTPGMSAIAVLIVAGSAIGFGLLGAVLTRAFLLPSRIRRLYNQQVSLSEEYVMWGDEAGLHVRTAHTSSHLPWHHYLKRRQNAATLLLYQSDAYFQFVPRRTLSDENGRRLDRWLETVPLRR